MVAVRNADDGRVGNGLRAQQSYSRREGWVAVKGAIVLKKSMDAR
jgi:hypothetical protein